MLYDDNLKFVFEPIVFYGFTNFTKSDLITINNQPHIISFTNALLNDTLQQLSQLVTICNLKGELQKQIPLPHNYTDIFTKNNHVVFFDGKYLYKTDLNLNLTIKSNRTSFAQGFTDINKDNKPEFVAFTDNILTIYTEKLDKNASFTINSEIDFSPVKNSFSTIHEGNNDYLIFSSNSYYYKFRYYKNHVAVIYITVYLIAFGILFLAFRLNIRRLEKENLKLEHTISERTKEIANQKEEILTQANELQTQNKNLLELNHFKKLMTDTVIHDLKNPLNVIIGKTNDKAIRQSGYNMLHIVLNILDINKAQSTKLSTVCTNQNVSVLIDDAIAQVDFLAEEKNIRFEKIIRKEFQIRADKDLTTRILVNLLTNALKYSPLNNKITIQVTEKNGFVQIDVTDYGIGISEKNVEFIFDEYTQLDPKKSGKVQSTGIGLTFCKIAAEAQKAKISVASVPKQKTTFSLAFSLVAVTEKRIDESVTNNSEILLDADQRKQFYHILLQLRQSQIFEATNILKLLNSIDNSSENIKRWKQKLKTALYASNNELFYKLIDNELQNSDN